MRGHGECMHMFNITQIVFIILGIVITITILDNLTKLRFLVKLHNRIASDKESEIAR